MLVCTEFANNNMNKCITNQNNYAYVYIYSPTQVTGVTVRDYILLGKEQQIINYSYFVIDRWTCNKMLK